MNDKGKASKENEVNAIAISKEAELLGFDSLKSGDHTIHVYIEETRGLINKNDKESTLDAMMTIETCEKTQKTRVKENTGTGMTFVNLNSWKIITLIPYFTMSKKWGEHLFFDVCFADSREMLSQKLKISVVDRKLLSNSLVGLFSIDLATIYLSDNHSLLHKWVALSNSKEDYSLIKGFLKFSVNITGPGDRTVKLEEEKIEEDSKVYRDKEGNNKIMGEPSVLMPPQLKTKSWQMEIHLIRAEGLPKMDWNVTGGKLDPYVVFEFAGAKFVTNVIKDNQQPVWNSKILLPYYEPTVCESLQVKVYDYDLSNKDEIVGSFFIKYTSSSPDVLTIKNNSYQHPFWVNIYGSQLDKKNKQAQIMNGNPDLASYWKGRIKMSVTCYECPNPKFESTGLDTKSILGDEMSWRLKIDLYYGLGYDSKNGKYTIMVRWGDKEEKFPCEGRNGLWEWFQSKNMDVRLPYQNFQEMTDVFIYLVYDDKKIAYIRKSAKFCQTMREAQILKFKVDKVINDKLREDQVGFIKMRLELGLGPDRIEKTSITQIPKPANKEGFMFVNLYYGKNLLPADSDGNSDPKVMVQYYGRTEYSKTIENTLNPIWFQKIKLKVPIFGKLEDSPPVLLNVYDEDMASSDDFLGNVIVDLKKGQENGYVGFNTDADIKPVWLPIQYDSENSKCGKLLVSFNIFSNEPPMTFSNEIRLPTENYQCKIRIVGLRGLQSLGLLPIKRAFVKFDINSLRRKEEKQALREKGAIVTQPSESGPNPNILTIIEFSLSLPKDIALCPFLSCTVHDHILKGLSQPVLGVFSIKLEEFIKKTIEGYKQSLDVLKVQSSIGNQAPLQSSKEKPPSISDQKTTQGIEIAREKSKEYTIEIPSISKEQKIEEITKPLLADEGVPKQEINLEPHELLHNHLDSPEPDVIDDKGVIHSHLIVRFPTYEIDVHSKEIKELGIPKDKNYKPLGWDSQANKLNKDKKKVDKHYRYSVGTELEESPFMDKNTFDEFTIKRSQRDSKESIFSVFGNTPYKAKPVGKLKCWVDILSESHSQEVNINRIQRKRTSEVAHCHKKLKKDVDYDFLDQKEVMVRVYVLSVSSLFKMDDNSLSDPYIQIRIGKQIFHNKKDYQKDKSDADFFTMFELKTILPGSSLLQVEVWDHDDFLTDDLIGETIIDLENRFYSPTWRSLDHIPIETRNIFHPDFKNSRGSIQLWCEIIDLTDKESYQKLNHVWNIKPKPPAEFEVRAIVWECEDIPNVDIEDASDLYVTGTIGDKTLKTDVHYRSQNGTGSFNWRMVWPVTLPMDDPTINFKIWDKDLLSGNDFICDGTIGFSDLAKRSFENDLITKMKGKEKPSDRTNAVKEGIQGAVSKAGSCFKSKNNKPEEKSKSERNGENFTIELPLKDDKGKTTKPGKLTLSFELVPASMAKLNKVGQGRGEPNHDPWLPPPVGRFEWSWNPLTLFNRCVGPKARWKICCAIWIILCCAILISLAPIIIGNALGNLLTK